MKPDDRICYCFTVSLRKLVNFARRERPQRASQMSECLGAGSGCGWCIPFLKKIWEDPDGVQIDGTPDDYSSARGGYITSEKAKNEF